MAAGFAPGVALLRVSGTQGTNVWAIVLHWYQGAAAAWTQSQINALNQSVQSHWPTSMSPLWPSTTIVTQIASADLTDTADRSNILAGISIGGTMTGTPYDYGASVLINYKINARYRGGHGRTYLPPPVTAASTNGDTWSAGHVTNVNAAWTTFTGQIKTDMSSAGLPSSSQCVPRWQYTYTDVPNKHKYTKEKGPFLGAYPVTSFTVSPQIRSQRRRLGP